MSAPSDKALANLDPANGQANVSPYDNKARMAKVVACLVQGMTVTEAAAETGVKTRQIYAWRKSDPDFQRMIEDADERVYNTLVNESVESVRTQIKDLGHKALVNLAESLDSDDERVRLQASGMVFRLGDFMSKEVTVTLGLEQHLAAIGGASPASGD